ncbi:hypothetical protein KTAU_03630 [Thermogemmatispora aurantia]|uniref:Uncharacterized protein n=1 Tax=Thermogemmatispora aurantia TaxID=2045279 RepID=A0A5J4K1Q5_9CHLR|nr:hypothetical protein KTAU_03630 [Thermogemmatispora aurantia]
MPVEAIEPAAGAAPLVAGAVAPQTWEALLTFDDVEVGFGVGVGVLR